MSRSSATFAKRERERSKTLKKQAKTLKRKDKPLNEEVESNIEETLVGKTIFSISSGTGKITGISQLEDGIEDYLVVQYEKNSGTDYIRVNGNHNFRVMSSEKGFDLALEMLGDPGVSVKFDSKKDRVHFYKELLKNQDVATIVKIVKELSSFDDLGTVEKKILDQCLSSVALEYSVQIGEELDASKEKVISIISN